MADFDIPVKPKDIQPSKLVFGAAKALQSGGRTVYINYPHSSGKLPVQTPLVYLPYGIGDWNDRDAASGNKTNGDKRYDLSFSFTDIDNNPHMKVFFDKMQDIKDVVLAKAVENHSSWFPNKFKTKEAAAAVLPGMFTPFARMYKDPKTGEESNKYAPTMKVKLPFDNKTTHDFSFEAFDMNDNPIDFKEIMTNLKGAKARLVIELTGMWFAAGMFGCTWRVAVGKFQLPTKRKLQFAPDSDDEDDAGRGNTKVEDSEDDDLAADAAAAVAAVGVADEEEDAEEEEEEPEEEEEHTPTPPPKKVVKKTVKKSAA